jgi:hypothetical protein
MGASVTYAKYMLMKTIIHVTLTLIASAYLLIIFVPNIDTIMVQYGLYSFKFFSVVFSIGVVLLNLLFLFFDAIKLVRVKVND